MDWLKKIKQIKEKLRQHDFNLIASEIDNKQMILGTPGEMYLNVIVYLLEIKQNNSVVWELIEADVTELVNYGKSIGYFTYDKM